MAFGYNVKLIQYPNGSSQIRLYKNHIIDSKSSDHDYSDDFSQLELSDLQDSFSDCLKSNYNRSVRNSLVRSKQKMYDYARSNVWEWFCTFTFSSDYDRTDYDLLLSKLRKWLDNLHQRKCPFLKYLIVPEEHTRIESNGQHAYHFHALLSNCEGLSFSPYMCKNGLPLTKKGRMIYTLDDYHFGFTNCQKVVDTFRISNYMTKYITKALTIRQKGKRRFLSSKNLSVPQITIGSIDSMLQFEDLKNEFYSKTVQVICGTYENSTTYIEIPIGNDEIITNLYNYMLGKNE